MAVIEKMEATSLIADQTREQIQLIDQEIKGFEQQKKGISIAPKAEEESTEPSLQHTNNDKQVRDSLVNVHEDVLDKLAAYLLRDQQLSKDSSYQVSREAAKKHLLKKHEQMLSLEIDILNQKIAQEQEQSNSKQLAQQSQQSELDSKKVIIEDYEKMIAATKAYKKELVNSLKETTSALQALRDKREAFNVKIEQTIIAELSGKNLRSSAPEYTIYRGKSIASLQGKLNSPLAQARIIRSFGKQNHPSLSSIKVVNNGIDLSSNSSRQVTAVADGKVISIMTIPGFDQLIILQHDDYYTVYSKIDEVSVFVDQQVNSGDTLGRLLAEDGQYELHFEIWKGKQKLNPTKWLRPL